METLSWLFVIIAKQVAFKYLIVQPFFLVIGLVRLSWWNRALIIRLLLKLGVPPFHVWAVHVLRYLNKRIFVFITTLHKVVPILLIVKLWGYYLVTPVLLLSVLTLSLILQSRGLFIVITFSSILHRGWIILRGGISIGFYWIYLISYVSLVFGLFSSLSIDSVLFGGSSQRLAASLYWLVLSGIPPFVMFWLKLFIIRALLRLSTATSFSILVAVLMSTLAYFRVFVLTKARKARMLALVLPFACSLAVLIY